MFKQPSDLTPNVEAPDLGGRRPILSVLRDKKGLSASLFEVLGALAISVVVMGGIGFGVAAGYNYSQDASAQSALVSVKSAQALLQSETGVFAEKDALTAGEPAALTAPSGKWDIAVTDRNWCAVIESQSMFSTKYWMTARSGEVLEEAPSAEEAGVACPTLEPAAS